MNYSGSHELVRLFPLQQAQASGALKEMEALAEKCMGDSAWGTMTRTGGGSLPIMTVRTYRS
jgi:hypothetical protein